MWWVQARCKLIQMQLQAAEPCSTGAGPHMRMRMMAVVYEMLRISLSLSSMLPYSTRPPVGTMRAIAARNSREAEALLATALKVCSLNFMPPSRKQVPAAKPDQALLRGGLCSPPQMSAESCCQAGRKSLHHTPAAWGGSACLDCRLQQAFSHARNMRWQSANSRGAQRGDVVTHDDCFHETAGQHGTRGRSHQAREACWIRLSR